MVPKRVTAYIAISKTVSSCVVDIYSITRYQATVNLNSSLTVCWSRSIELAIVESYNLIKRCSLAINQYRLTCRVESTAVESYILSRRMSI